MGIVSERYIVFCYDSKDVKTNKSTGLNDFESIKQCARFAKKILKNGHYCICLDSRRTDENGKANVVFEGTKGRIIRYRK